jgi:hypothetical protein
MFTHIVDEGIVVLFEDDESFGRITSLSTIGNTTGNCRCSHNLRIVMVKQHEGVISSEF